jgi:hypothetical protein
MELDSAVMGKINLEEVVSQGKYLKSGEYY